MCGEQKKEESKVTLGPSYIASGNLAWYSNYGNSLAVPQ